MIFDQRCTDCLNQMYAAREYEFDFQVEYVFKCKACGKEQTVKSQKKPSKLMRARVFQNQPLPIASQISAPTTDTLTSI